MHHKWVGAGLLLVGLAMSLLLGMSTAQETDDAPDCSADGIAAQQQALQQQFDLTSSDPQQLQANLFLYGAALQDLALRCGYVPPEAVRTAHIERTLRLATLAEIIAATAVGSDVDVALEEIEALYGDSFNGQLLFNGIEPGLDGQALGCANCHQGEVGPVVEGTWTRITEIYLNDPTLEGYDVRRYLVESILQPNAFTSPGYAPHLMPDNFGQRLDSQQLADLVAYLESQDQLLPE